MKYEPQITAIKPRSSTFCYHEGQDRFATSSKLGSNADGPTELLVIPGPFERLSRLRSKSPRHTTFGAIDRLKDTKMITSKIETSCIITMDASDRGYKAIQPRAPHTVILGKPKSNSIKRSPGPGDYDIPPLKAKVGCLTMKPPTEPSRIIFETAVEEYKRGTKDS